MRVKNLILEAKAPRRVWWIGLAILMGSAFAGYWIHDAGISRWFREISFWHSFVGVLVFGLGLAVFLLVSQARTNDLNSSGRLWWLILLPPIWVSVMGVVPSPKEDETPIGPIFRRLFRWLAIASAAIAALFGGYFWFTSTSLPALGSRSMLFSECQRFLTAETTRTQAQRTIIVDTEILTIMRLRKEGRSVLLTCSKLDGKLLITEGED